MPNDIQEFLWWAFLLLVAVIGFFIKERVAGLSALEKRITQLESKMVEMNAVESQIMSLLKEQKNDTRERISEIKSEFKEMRDTLNEQLNRQSRKLDLIFERVMNRPHDERQDDA